VCNREHALRDIGVFEGEWMVQNIMPTKDDEEGRPYVQKQFTLEVQIAAVGRKMNFGVFI